eukprot:1158929-Pelagomonas_calceolata.AAC.4
MRRISWTPSWPLQPLLNLPSGLRQLAQFKAQWHLRRVLGIVQSCQPFACDQGSIRWGRKNGVCSLARPCKKHAQKAMQK